MLSKRCKSCDNPAPKSRKLCHSCRGKLKYYADMTPCECGCGEQAARRFCNGHHTRLLSSDEQRRRGNLNDGSAARDPEGATSYRKVNSRHEHRNVAEEMIGRKLLKGEIVHHINRDKRDNRPENLQVMSRAEHITVHRDDMIRGRRNARKN